MSKSDERHTLFGDTVAQTGLLPNIQGPAHGFISLLDGCGCSHQVGNDGIRITNNYTGESVNLLGGSKVAFNRFVHDAEAAASLVELQTLRDTISATAQSSSKQNASCDIDLLELEFMAVSKIL